MRIDIRDLPTRRNCTAFRRNLPATFQRLIGVAICCLGQASVGAEDEVLYSTSFEFSEGFDSAYELPWQGGWVGDPYYDTADAINSSGIISNATTPPFQEAYVGFFRPNPPRPFVSVWRPINHVPTNKPLVQFEVLMTITDSTTDHPNADNFRWSVYNIDGQRLFTVDFDNYFTDVSYLLDEENPMSIVTTQRFTNNATFSFSLTMNFEFNLWSAAIDGVTFISNQPITTVGATLTLGDVDAVWAIFDPDNPGDNFMAFDDYRLTALPAETGGSRLELLTVDVAATALRLHGSSGFRYAIETSTNMVDWIPLKTNVTSDGSFDFVHVGAEASAVRTYRARFVP